VTKPVLVQNSVHGDVRIDVSQQARLCKGLRNTSVVLQEFKLAALEYPIVLTKNPETGAFSAVALFGFDEDENLYVTEDGQWDAWYLPLNIVRGPFMLGTQQLEGSPTENVEHVLLVDMEDPRVNKENGELLFNDRGFPTTYLERITSVIKSLKDGIEETSAFIDVLLKLNLIAPAQLKIEFLNGEHRDVRGVYTIEPEELKRLSVREVQELHEQGYLEPIYALAISFGHIRTLIERKNKLLQKA
jgi:hypothetical protein